MMHNLVLADVVNSAAIGHEGRNTTSGLHTEHWGSGGPGHDERSAWMETDKIMFARRALLSSIFGAGCGAALVAPALVAPAWADVAQYPQLADPAIPVRNLTRLYFVAGASAGSRVFAGGQEGVIIYSDDKGQTWAQANVPVSATITSIAFASPKVGWATGALGVILKTEDGGKSWVKQLDGIAEIALMNSTTQAYDAAEQADQAKQKPNSDAANADADAIDRANRRQQILAGQGPDKAFLSLLPVSETEVFAFGAYRFAEYSTDGGKTWADWSMHIGDEKSQNIYGAAAIGGAFYLTSETGLIFRSTDGGQSFTQLAQPGNATFFGIMDTGAGGLLAYGVAGEMYLSTDQGKSWNQPNFTGTSNVNSVVALPDSGLLVAGDAGGGLWISKDHGNSFILANRNPIMSINALLATGPTSFLILSGVGVFPVDLSKMGG
jgi:photosystem II stability/assembly factor-like uncharacterized protein